MDKHLTILGALQVAVAALNLLSIPIVVAALGGSSLAVLAAGQPGVFALMSGLSVSIGLLLAAMSVPGIVAGIGLLRRRPWWRAGTAIASVFNLVNPPFGPLLGLYTLWVLFRIDADGVRTA